MADKEKSPERKVQVPEGDEQKKSKSKAFPLGTPEEKERTPEGKDRPEEITSPNEEVPSGDQTAPSGKDRESSDLSEPLKETIETPSGGREANMPLDEEGKEFVKEAVRKGVEGLNEKLGLVEGKVVQNAETTHTAIENVEKAAKAIEEKLGKTGPATETNDTAVAEARVAEKVRKQIRDEQKEERLRQEADEKARKQREEDKKFRDWCFLHPEAAKCKNIGELITKVVKHEIKESSQVKKEEPATPKPETELQPLEKMTDEKRDAMTEEQSQARDTQVEPILARYNLSDNDLARKILKLQPNIDNLAKKPVLREAVSETHTPEERVKVIAGACEDGVCLVKMREGGYSILKKEKDGKWKPVDEEIAKQMKPLF